MEEILKVFIQEAREKLAEMETGLMRMESEDPDAELINAVFRAAHTIKGSAGVVDLVLVVAFTHVVENALDKLRNNEIAVNGALISALLNCCDHIGALIGLAESGQCEAGAELDLKGKTLCDELRGLSGAAVAAASPVPAGLEQVQEVETPGAGRAASDCWHVSVRFGRDVFRHGNDPAAILRYLLTLGEIAHITTVFDAIPVAAEMDPESCYLGFEINLRSRADKAAIEQIFEFVRDECELRILPPHSRVDDYLRLIEELPEETMRLGEILVKSGALTQEELDKSLLQQRVGQKVAQDDVPAARLGQILVDSRRVQPALVEAAVAKQKQVSERRADEARLIRVHADKLDQLIDLIGELVIAGASANLAAQRAKQVALTEATSVLSRLVESIRDSALQLRMVQIGETFNRFNRVVRDTAKELNKEVNLIITGGDTDLDKSVVEKIGDPLMHLVRNAMDHGLEPAAERLASGKPAVGRIELNAYHDSGSIVIEVIDDGRGLPREKIRAKAIEKGIIAEGQVLSAEEIASLIFAAGFSTAENVTNLSGRGVGMDVVRRNIEALRGSVDVKSEEGRGSRFTIRLPLTLAIIDGFLVGVDKSSFVIPLEMVVECRELETEISSNRNYIDLRGQALPILRLRDLFEVKTPRPARENVVVVKSGTHKVGIVVDVLHGEFQTVIKPLGAMFRHLQGIAGSTILGSGEVSLILDVQALANLAAAAQKTALAVAEVET